MALWGNNDNRTVNTAAGVAITVSGTTVTGTATTFTNFTAGDVITIGLGATQGYAVIASIASTTSMTLVDTDTISSNIAGATVHSVGQKPKYLDEDPRGVKDNRTVGVGSTSFKVFGVDGTMASARSGASSKYAVAHAGWVGVQTYIDCHGTLRVKSETIVAMSGITTQTQVASHVLPVT